MNTVFITYPKYSIIQDTMKKINSIPVKISIVMQRKYGIAMEFFIIIKKCLELWSLLLFLFPYSATCRLQTSVWFLWV